MRRAFFTAMLLTLARDRAALVMAFVLPAFFFVIFALIFVGASGADITVRVAIADEQASPSSARFVDGLARNARIEAIGAGAFTGAEVRALVRSDAADVGVIIKASGRPLEEFGGDGPAPIEVVSDPTREISTSVVVGTVQEVYFAELADAVVTAVAGAPLPQGAPRPEPIDFSRMIEKTTAVADTGVAPAVSYYAGAVAAMFLLFSALNGAMTLVAERESGLIDRVTTGPGGIGAVIDGKFMFLVAQGLVQVAIIFLVAWIGFGVDLPANAHYWAVTTLIAATAAAALALGFVAVCRTHVQAQTIGTVAVIIISALGGSMVPRFLMPESIRDVGWGTPNAWIIDAYGAIFWRSEGWEVLTLPWAMLAAIAAAGLTVAHVFARRRK
jgi:ABC-2 type transport system permease protein